MVECLLQGVQRTGDKWRRHHSWEMLNGQHTVVLCHSMSVVSNWALPVCLFVCLSVCHHHSSVMSSEPVWRHYHMLQWSLIIPSSAALWSWSTAGLLLSPWFCFILLLVAICPVASITPDVTAHIFHRWAAVSSNHLWWLYFRHRRISAMEQPSCNTLQPSVPSYACWILCTAALK